MSEKLYAFRAIPEGFTVLKCDNDFNLLGSYVVAWTRNGYACNCPAGRGSVANPCRHKTMLDAALDKNTIDKPVFHDFETGRLVKVVV